MLISVDFPTFGIPTTIVRSVRPGPPRWGASSRQRAGTRFTLRGSFMTSASGRTPGHASCQAAVTSGSELGQYVQRILVNGELVGDNLMADLIRDRLAQDDTHEGFLLDGYPRTAPQVETLNGILQECGVTLDEEGRCYSCLQDEADYRRDAERDPAFDPERWET